jgi:hypothetical protein
MSGAALLLTTGVTACVGAGAGADGAPPALYVVHSPDGVLARLDAATGRALGPPLPAGPAPWQIAPGPDGSLLVLTAFPARQSALTHIVRTPRGWSARAIALGVLADDAILAADGGRYPVVADHLPDARPGAPAHGCRVALVDALVGRVARTYAPCAEGEWLTGVAVLHAETGPMAYLGIRGTSPGSITVRPTGRDRIVAIDAERGTRLAARPLAGPPSHLLLAAAPGRLGRRLYGVEALDGLPPEPGMPFRGRLLGLNPDTLELESVHALAFSPAQFVVAPEGDQVYALFEQDVLRLDLVGGGEARLASLPEPGAGLAVTRDRVYVSDLRWAALWVFDRHRERPLPPVRVGRYPTALLVAPVRASSAAGRARRPRP